MKSIIYSPAKINIFLKIEGKDKISGMHFIRSLFSPTDFCDRLEIEENNRFSVVTEGIDEPIPTEKNIIFKVWSAAAEYIGQDLPKFSVRIEKSIPTGAGLGGGSSNAAAFLSFLNDYAGLGLDISQLSEIAIKTGSDVPFFLHGKAAVVSGLGDMIEPCDLPESCCSFVLLNPDVHVDTKLAYSLFDRKYPEFCTEKKVTQPFRWQKEQIFNDFEEVVFEAFPKIAEVKSELEKAGAFKVFMSGSGSTLVAMTDDKAAERMVSEFSGKFRTVRKIKLA